MGKEVFFHILKKKEILINLQNDEKDLIYDIKDFNFKNSLLS